MTATRLDGPDRPSRHGRLRVLFFVEEELLRLGLESLMPRLPLQVESTFAADEREFRRRLRERSPDVVVVASTNRRHWRAGITESAGRPPQSLLILEEHQVSDDADLPIYPADGYLIRQRLSADGLSQALSRLVTGTTAVQPAIARQLIKRTDGTTAADRPSSNLTARQTETLVLLVKGLSNKQIGRRLHISEHGAKRLVSSVLLKLDATNRTSAVVKAIKAGLVDEAMLDRAAP
jgi:two-component system, NarL family, nitrate/nitrite response regulator NarL